MNRTVSEFLRNPRGSSFESAINLSVNRVVGKSSVENPENILISKIFLYWQILTGRGPQGWRESGEFLVSSWTASDPQSCQSPSWGPWPRPGRSPRRRGTTPGSRPPRQRRECPGLQRGRSPGQHLGTLLTLQGADVVGPELGLLRQRDVLGVQIHGHDAGRLLQLNKRKYWCVYNYFQCVHKKSSLLKCYLPPWLLDTN